MSSASEPVGTLDVALAHAGRLLTKEPALAAEQASEILKAVPGHPHARLIVGQAHRLAGHTQAALEVLEPLAREQPRSAAVQLELGISQGEAGRFEEAAAALRRAAQLKPDLSDAWRALADVLDAVGDGAGADQARARYIQAATKDPRLLEAAAALVANNLPVAEARLRAHLTQYPTDVAALRMLAEIAARLRRYADAEQLLTYCLELAPSFDAARFNLAVVLNRLPRAVDSLREVERLLAREPRNPGYRNLKATVLASLGNYAESIDLYEKVLGEYPNQPKVWMSYGHALKTAGRIEDSIHAYRRSIVMEPTLGDAYWSLANLKTFRFADADVAGIRAALARTDLSDEDRLHFEFALGKALEDAEAWEDSFTHYAAGNEIRRKQVHYRAADSRELVRRAKVILTPEFFAARAGWGATAADPIFILGMPRAGSTLLEQILSSHSMVEGTMELPDIPAIAHDLVRRAGRPGGETHADILPGLTRDELRSYGERYLEATRVQRKTPAPFFVDKMPNNWPYVGLIHLMLPNARIIDARRHPLGCCFSGFKQHFARGQGFSYSLADIGEYYRDYVELMAHFDAVLPGRVHRVIYERTIADTETEVRRLLDYCGLPFEEQCLRFYENDRAVRTASSEQVRQPIFREGVDHWRHYEPWLGPLKEALGPVLDCYPAVPVFAPAVESGNRPTIITQ
ncbi:MAG TPA: sulfotransferase [Steroidobacteraceae bacterium]|nr:sulfotransferase [Steroidobacteraceae bacterium]